MKKEVNSLGEGTQPKSRPRRKATSLEPQVSGKPLIKSAPAPKSVSQPLDQVGTVDVEADTADSTWHLESDDPEPSNLVDLPPAVLTEMEQDGIGAFPRYFISKKRKRRFNKPNSLVHNRPHSVLTVTQQKILNILYYHAQQHINSGDSSEYWTIRFKDILEQLNVETRNWTHLNEVIDAMQSIRVKFDALEETGVAQHYIVVFPHIKLLNGLITFQIHNVVLKILASSKTYTRFIMEDTLPLTRACSIPLYEFCARYAKLRATRWIHWKLLRSMILAANDIPKNAETWTKFNKFYLAPAIDDINAQTNLSITLEKQTSGSSVEAVRLIVYRNESALENSSAMSSTVSNKQAIVDSMAAFGIKKTEIQTFLSEYSSEDLSSALVFTKARMERKNLEPLKFPGRFFKTALKEQFYKADAVGVTKPLFEDRNNVPQIQVASNELTPVGTAATPSRTVGQTSSDSGRAKLVAAVQTQRLIQVKSILGEMSQGQMLELYEIYNSQIETKALMIHDVKKNKPGVMQSFHSWYTKHLWGEITDAEIIETMGKMLSA